MTSNVFGGIVKLTNEQYITLKEAGSLTVAGTTLTYDPATLYITTDDSAENDYLPLTGGNLSGHVYLTGAQASSSTGNTSQLVFGTSSDNHLAVTSNKGALVLNPTTASTSGQIVLYTGTGTSRIPGSLTIGYTATAGTVTANTFNVNASGTINLNGTSNSTGANLKWGTVNSKNPYIGYATDQSDGTFVWSITDTKYVSGLAIGGGSGNLLWKGNKVATVSDLSGYLSSSNVVDNLTTQDSTKPLSANMGYTLSKTFGQGLQPTENGNFPYPTITGTAPNGNPTNITNSSFYYKSVAYGNGVFVTAPTVANSNLVYSTQVKFTLYSYDGINWNINTTTFSTSGYNVTFTNGRFYLYGKSSRYYSFDGINWISAGSTSSYEWTAPVGNGKIYVTLANDSGFTKQYSYDGIKWQGGYNESTGSTIGANVVAYGNGRFVTVGESNMSAYSTDGITWTKVTSNLPGTSSTNWTSLVFDGAKFVAAATSLVAYSTDGVSWTTGTGFTGPVNDIIYTGEMYVTFPTIHYSYDGITWTKATSEYTGLSKATYGNGKFISVPNSWSSGNVYRRMGVELGSLIKSTRYELGKVAATAMCTNYVISYYRSSDGLTWFRKWADGWMECGGKTSVGENSTVTITLPITFSSTTYQVIVSNASGKTSSNAEGLLTGKPSTTSQIILSGGYLDPNTSDAYWECKGY